MANFGSAGGVRDRGNPELKLQRMRQVRDQVLEELNRDRVPTSESCARIIQYTRNTKDYMVPSVWGELDKREDPYNPVVKDSGCCVIM
ncbi:G-protein gamma-like domain-containing protein [Kockiozyma suomiensis]|uniref:G-protein gamma-like domain-containing protein n=1 Tax=Kockiozyma suomiensis TaxID=1337062 RepID=UPI003343CEFE